MLCFLMYFLTNFIFGTRFAVTDYVGHDTERVINVLMTYDSFPDKTQLYFTKEDRSLGRSNLGVAFTDKRSYIIMDFLKLRYVDRIYTSRCNSKDMTVSVEHLDSRSSSQCITTIEAGATCKSLVRVAVIKNMPKNCALHVAGYTSHLNWYLGCIKADRGNYTLKRDRTLTIYEECAVRCDDNDYIGLFVVQNVDACKCFRNLNGMVSVKQELCRNLCDAAPDYCGGEDSYISLYMSERLRAKSYITMAECLVYGINCYECRDGWKGYNCELTDCETSNGNCGSMECHNLTVWGERFRTCSCGDGYKLSDVWGKCDDIDECAEKSICPEGQICTNTEGSFVCHCQEGYQIGETGACTDVDECNTSMTFCDALSTICFNNAGSYSCKCRDGFRSDAMKINVCEDLDECLANPCDRTSTNCRNILGSFDCSCFLGYHKIGYFRCEDDDECGSLFRKCPIGVPCVNLPGTYECYCPTGTKKNVQFYGTDCDDIDECLDDYICDRTSSFCVNAIKSYACICRLEFVQVDNFTCKAQDAIFTRASTQTVSSEIFTNEPAEESSTTSNAFYFGLGLLITLCMVSCFGCLCFAAKKAKSVISNQSSASAPSIEMEVHVEENTEY